MNYEFERMGKEVDITEFKVLLHHILEVCRKP
jgi:hypothetical protein